MRLVAYGDIEVRTLVDLERDLGGTDDDHYVLVLRDLRHGIHHLLSVHREMHDLPMEVLGGLLPGDAGLYGIIPAEAVHHAADVLLEHGIVGIHVDALGAERPG